MALIQEQIPNLINGVSQQPATQRLPSQCEEQDNCLVDLAKGLRKRPPTDHIAKLNERTDDLAYVHTINRDSSERFKVIIHSSQFSSAFSSAFSKASVEVYDTLTGESKFVNGFDGDVETYLTTPNPRDDLHVLTVADFTFILNKTKTVAKLATTGDTRNPEGLVFLKQATNLTAVKVYVDGVLRANTIGNNADTVITTLFNSLESSIGSTGNGTFTVTKFAASHIHLTKVDGSDFTLHVTAPEVNAIAIKDTVEDFTDLPSRTKDGMIIKVIGQPGDEDDDYYLKMENQGDDDVGQWVEVVGPGLANSLDPATMPVQLVRTTGNPWSSEFGPEFGGDGFSLSQITWSDREAGDETTNPDPTFVGQTISDMFFYKNRFGFTAGENLILSELGGFFNFYLTTATDLLDTDVIDVAAPSNDVSKLHAAVSFDGGLICWSDRAQFKLKESTTAGLTPTIALLELVTEFLNSTQVHPILIGSKVYYAETKDGFGSIREFGFVEDFTSQSADDLTAHIPSYITGNVTRFHSAKSDDLLFCLSDTDKNEVYVYKFLIQNGQKVLSSWGKWVFEEDSTVLDMGVIDSIVYLVIKRPDGTYLEKLSLQTANLTNLTPSSTQMSFKVMLDRLTTVTGVYDGTTTTFTVPYSNDPSTLKFVQGPAFGGSAGSLIQAMTRVDSDTYTVLGDFSAGMCWVGKAFNARYVFTEPTIKIELGGKPNSLPGGRMSVRQMTINYDNTPFFNVKVSSPNRDDSNHLFTRILGSPNSNIGEIPFESGRYSITIMRNAEDLTIEASSDSYFPMTLTGAHWLGNYVTRTGQAPPSRSSIRRV
jgi:hypothetical protein